MSRRSRFITAVRIRWLHRAARERQRGMTLLEVMIVMALIALIASAIGTAVFLKYRHGQERAARMLVGRLQEDVTQYLTEHDRCPTVEDLVTEHLIPAPPRDPWGKPITLRCPSEHEPDPADVVSYGPDGVPDTKDDIRSWEH